MPKAKTTMLVSFTAERLRALDDSSAKLFRDRIGEALVHKAQGTHVCVDFPPDGTRRPVRLERVPLEYLNIIQQT